MRAAKNTAVATKRKGDAAKDAPPKKRASTTSAARDKESDSESSDSDSEEDNRGLVDAAKEVETAAASYSSPTRVALDILPPQDKLLWSVRIDSPSAIAGAVGATVSMLTDVTLWVCNNQVSYDRAKAAADAAGSACALNRFAGISIDTTDAHLVAMAVARMPLSLDCVNIYVSETGPDGKRVPKEEVGIKISVKDFTNSLRGVKDYQNMVMYQERESNVLTLMIVSDARDPLYSYIPLKESEAVHETVDGWDMHFDISMPLADFKDVVRKAGMYEAESINFRMHRWYEDKIIFVMATDSYNGNPNLFRAFQAVYTTMLKRSMTAEADQALKRFKQAQDCLSASDPRKEPALQLKESGIEDAERALKAHVFIMYDTFPVPAGFVKPARKCTDVDPMTACEKEVRELQEAVWAYNRKYATNPTRNASELLEKVNATAVEVISSYSPGIRAAPFRREEILQLPCEFDAWFSVKKLLDMLKAPQSASVQLNFPKDSNDPIAIRFDTGDSAYMSWILAPRIDRE
jgi:hypothetical protein